MRKLRPKWLVYVMVLVLIAVAPISAAADDTPNGQPFLEIWEELGYLQEQIDGQLGNSSNIQAQLDAEIAARIAGDTVIQADVDTEETARIADVDTEETARIADVDAEEAARIAADNTLQTNINNLAAIDALDYDSLADLEAAMANGVKLAKTSGDVGIGTTSTSHKLTIKSTDDDTLRLIGPDSIYGYGARLNFGDWDYVYIEEDTDDHLRIHSWGGTEFTGGTVNMDRLEVGNDDKVKLFEEYGDIGIVLTYGPNGNRNCRFTYLSGYPNNGYIVVSDSVGTDQAGIYVTSDGKGKVYGDTKSFCVDNPNDPNTEIWYTSVEGPEAAAYIRGTAQLVDGRAVITFPDHFLAVAVEDGMTVQVTPLSAESKGLAVTSKSLDGVVVQELFDGTGNYEFDWEVKCIRQGHEDYQVIRPKMDESPGVEQQEITTNRLPLKDPT